uniref:Uncharacterized protein n=1 Tax=Chromera velia CCMP2878 TaxID=1169474 RepID=A0A0G4EZH5_9ALVE|eukprot:Cvel_14212.t1-p1 / transcript=Cvel_14212.t1 / gene=Cvel_14212 / organism=Chromera_velia_CCMP2878 / gene_product=hypothetical protein / transcript_product=hypothetical protein / location=Cvel_scaffold1002:25252-27151(-) / protein_length=575 / sequence_SO=supercontig / SO=protein_coding / is_pseudo=false
MTLETASSSSLWMNMGMRISLASLALDNPEIWEEGVLDFLGWRRDVILRSLCREFAHSVCTSADMQTNVEILFESPSLVQWADPARMRTEPFKHSQGTYPYVPSDPEKGGPAMTCVTLQDLICRACKVGDPPAVSRLLDLLPKDFNIEDPFPTPPKENEEARNGSHMIDRHLVNAAAFSPDPFRMILWLHRRAGASVSSLSFDLRDRLKSQKDGPLPYRLLRFPLRKSSSNPSEIWNHLALHGCLPELLREERRYLKALKDILRQRQREREREREREAQNQQATEEEEEAEEEGEGEGGTEENESERQPQRRSSTRERIVRTFHVSLRRMREELAEEGGGVEVDEEGVLLRVAWDHCGGVCQAAARGGHLPVIKWARLELSSSETPELAALPSRPPSRSIPPPSLPPPASSFSSSSSDSVTDRRPVVGADLGTESLPLSESESESENEEGKGGNAQVVCAPLIERLGVPVRGRDELPRRRLKFRWQIQTEDISIYMENSAALDALFEGHFEVFRWMTRKGGARERLRVDQRDYCQVVQIGMGCEDWSIDRAVRAVHELALADCEQNGHATPLGRT